MVQPRTAGRAHSRPPANAEDPASMLQVPDYLRLDRGEVPDALFERTEPSDAPAAVPVEAFTSTEYARREDELLWGRVWQMACREREIPAPGDFTTYQIGARSLILSRQDDGSVRAFHNVCRHRGTRLVDGPGSGTRFTCSFHGWSWTNDGSLAQVPCRWDFPTVNERSHRLAEVRVDTWNGFVFVNFDPGAAPLADFLGDVVPRHFERWPLADRFKAVHVAKVLPCNWKIALEAFLEIYHAARTHPTSSAYTADVNAQYDSFGLHARFINMFGAPSPHLGEMDEDDVLDAMLQDALLAAPPGSENGLSVPEGGTARQVLADFMRQALPPSTGRDYTQVSDTEMIDVYQYFVFPNLVPWASFGFPLCYRALPGPTPDTCVWEVMIFSSCPDGAEPPPDAPRRMTPSDEPWSAVAELGGVAAILDQDMYNLRRIQPGLASGGLGEVTFSRYQEGNLRAFHDNLAGYVGPVRPD